MPTRFLLAATLSLLAALLSARVAAAPASGHDDGHFDADAIVARVDGEAITLQDLFTRFASLPPLVRERYATSGGLRGLLQDSVASLAIAHEAAAMRLEDDPLFSRLLAIRREEVLRDLYARHTVVKQLDDAALAVRYEAQKESRFHRPAAAHVREILISPAAARHPFSPDPDAVGDDAAATKARRLHSELAKGADFAAVARRASEDASASSGGDIGWVNPRQLLPEVDRAVWALPVGQVSEVIATVAGEYLVRVEERIEAGYVPFAAVRELLFQEAVLEGADALSRVAQQDRERLLAQHRIELHPELLP